jgi:hypothetical protein
MPRTFWTEGEMSELRERVVSAIGGQIPSHCPERIHVLAAADAAIAICKEEWGLNEALEMKLLAADFGEDGGEHGAVSLELPGPGYEVGCGECLVIPKNGCIRLRGIPEPQEDGE